MATQKKRRKAAEQQTVRMRSKHWADFVWTIQAYLGNRWVNVPAAGKNIRFWTTYGIGPHRRSGNVWLRRLAKQLGVKLTAKWE